MSVPIRMVNILMVVVMMLAVMTILVMIKFRGGVMQPWVRSRVVWGGNNS